MEESVTRSIIERFNDGSVSGYNVIAGAFDMSVSAVWNWPERGIPGNKHLSLLRLARERGVPLTDDELLATKRR